MLNTGDHSRPSSGGNSRIDDATVCPSMADVVGRWSSRCWFGVALLSRWWRVRFVVRGWSRRVSVAGARCLVTPRDAGTPWVRPPEPFGRSERIECASFAGVDQPWCQCTTPAADRRSRHASTSRPRRAETSRDQRPATQPSRSGRLPRCALQTIYRWRYRHEGPAGYRVGVTSVTGSPTSNTGLRNAARLR